MSEWKSCPFCGDSVPGFNEGSTHRWMTAGCGSCGANIEVRKADYGLPASDPVNQVAGIGAWNTRHPDPATTAATRNFSRTEIKLKDSHGDFMNDEINKLVHQALGECIHEWKFQPSVEKHSGYICQKCGKGNSEVSTHKMPDYCSDLNAAFKFVEKLIADGFRFACEWDDWGLGKWAVKVNEFVRSDRLLATAICLAGLSALGISVSPEEAKRSV